MKKLLALVLAAAMLLGITSALAEETPTLTLWCIATESDSNHVAYEKAIPEIEEALGVKIEWEAFENDSYKTKIKSTSAEELPDIFFTWAGAFCGDFATAGKVYCLDEAYAEYADALPDVMTKNATYDGKRYAVPLTMNIVAMFANMDLLAQVGYEDVPTTYEELKAVCATIAEAGITPWFIPGADGWQHQLAFFQIGGVYEEAQPGLYDALNNNTATFAGNEKMLEVLGQFKELSDLGYFGEDWIGTDSTNMANEYGDRAIAMAMANSSYIKQLQTDLDTEDEFGMFLIPLGDNTWFPTSPAGPTMFGYKGTEHEDLVRAWFQFVCTPESLQEILDNSPNYTNLHVNVDIEQHWLPEEEAFVASIPAEKMNCCVLQNGTKYTNDYWMQFGQDMIEYIQGGIEANDVLARMDGYRAEAAANVGDANWQ